MSRRTPAAVLDLLAAVSRCSPTAVAASWARSPAGHHRVGRTPGHELTTQGRIGLEFMLVIDGQARCLIDEIEVGTYGPGDYFGELALIDGKPRAATIVVVTRTWTLMVLHRGEFNELLDRAPSISRGC